jgi:hypothetical protein
VHEGIITSGWDALILGIPFIGLLFLGFFRLDELIIGRKPSSGGLAPGAGPRNFSGGLGADGETVVRDPDGRPSPKSRRRRSSR